MVPPGSILYNLEQLGGPSYAEAFLRIGAALQVWDYSLHNIATWNVMRCPLRPSTFLWDIYRN